MKIFLFFLLISLLVPLGSLASPAPLQSPAKIHEIVLEAKGGFNFNPVKFYGAVFKVTFQRDGMAIYAGSRDVKPIGSYQGTISSDEFEKLVKFVVARDYLSIPTDVIQASQTPSPENGGFKPTNTVTITYEGGQKTIWRYAELSPLEREKVPKALFEIEQAILDLSTRTKWREVE